MLIGLLLVFSSCEKDPVLEEEVHGHKHGKGPNEVSMEFFKRTTQIEDVGLFLKKHMAASSLLARQESYHFSDFQIDTETIVRCDLKDGEIAFSFFLQPKEGVADRDEMFNLVISRIQGEWRSTIFLLKMDLTAQEVEKYTGVEPVYSEIGMVSPVGRVRFANGYTINFSFHCTNTGKCLREGKCDLCKLCVTKTVSYSFNFEEQEHDSPVFTINEGSGGSGNANHGTSITTDPCTELLKISNTLLAKKALKDLEDYVHLDEEKGYYITKNSQTGGYKPPTVANSTYFPGRIDMPTGGDNIGCFHTHPSVDTGAWPMFSDGDLNYLFRVAQRHNNAGQQKNYSEYFITLTVPHGTFALKIKDWTKFAIFRNSDKWDNSEGGGKGELREFNIKFKKISPIGDINLMKNALLQILKDNNAGVGLYEANEDLTSWSELELSPDATTQPATEPIKKSCN